MAIDSVVESIRARIDRYKNRALGEQNTKASLIEPVLEALGWDIRNPDEVHREYRANSKDNPVDYALKVLRQPRLFIEAKGLGEDLSDRRWISQVLAYATMAGVGWCVLTDGNRYRVFNASERVDADQKLFQEFSMAEGPLDRSLQILELIARRNLEGNLLDLLWDEHFVDRQVKAGLTDLFSNGKTELAKFLQRRMRRLSEKQVQGSLRRLEIQVTAPDLCRVGDISRRTSKRSRVVGKEMASSSLKTQSLQSLVDQGRIQVPTALFKNYKGTVLQATLLKSGNIRFQGEEYESPSTAASVARSTVTGKPMATNGWDFWQFKDADGATKTLGQIRDAEKAVRATRPKPTK